MSLTAVPAYFLARRVLSQPYAILGVNVAAYKLPEAVDVVEALPRTPMEKVDRRALQEALAAEDSTTGLS